MMHHLSEMVIIRKSGEGVENCVDTKRFRSRQQGEAKEGKVTRIPTWAGMLQELCRGQMLNLLCPTLALPGNTLGTH